MRNNSHGDCNAVDGGRIERTETPARGGNAGQPVGVGVAEGPGSRAVVSTEAELRAALDDSSLGTVVVTAGARIELSCEVRIERSVRIEGEGSRDGGDGVVLPTIVGAEGDDMLSLTSTSSGICYELEGLRLEGRGGLTSTTIKCSNGVALTAVRCEFVRNYVCIHGEGTRAKLRDCTVVDSKLNGIFVYGGASLSIEGGAVRGSDQAGVSVTDADSRAEVRLPLTRTQHHCWLLPLVFRLLEMV